MRSIQPNLIRILFLTVLSISLSNCSKDEVQIIDGQVVSQNGDPIEGAEIHFVPTILDKAKLKPSTYISYTIPEASDVRLEMYTTWSGELIEVLVNAYQSAGAYAVQTTDSLYTNRLYEYRLSIFSIGAEQVKELFLAAPAEELIGTKPITTTDLSGHFELEIGEFAIGKEFATTTELGPDITVRRVTNQVELIAIKDGIIIARKNIEVDEDKKNEVTLIAD